MINFDNLNAKRFLMPVCEKTILLYVVVEECEFAESKGSGNNASSGNSAPTPSSVGGGFMNIPDGIDEELPFN